MHSSVEEREAKLFPERDDVGAITCSTLTNEFLIYGTEVRALFLNIFLLDVPQSLGQTCCEPLLISPHTSANGRCI